MMQLFGRGIHDAETEQAADRHYFRSSSGLPCRSRNHAPVSRFRVSADCGLRLPLAERWMLISAEIASAAAVDSGRYTGISDRTGPERGLADFFAE
jgi:hypothetical protein